ncbi:MAG: extracellular solute-binding protein [Candidatus Pacebacteria bacterium]|nr:extracellular solute-binding protein [Candidatus Paceibacterota bacterium]
MLGALLMVGCGESADKPASGETTENGVVIEAWAHSGRESERRTIRNQVRRFNEGQNAVHVKLTVLPEGSYNSQVQAAALAHDLPDVLEFDGPFVYNYVWQGHLTPIGELLSDELMDNLLPSIVEQGTYRGAFYSVGMFDSGLALYARRSKLDAVGARIPDHPKDAWTVEEFERILADLAADDDDGQVLDLKLNYEGEWFTYAFSPALQSGGADLIERGGYDTASGVLNGSAGVRVMQRFQKWMKEDNYVDSNVDDNAFVGGRVALSWVGHWEYPRYSKAFGDDLVLVPLPDFGEGSRTGQGSWNWSITKRCKHPAAVASFLEFLLQDPQVLEMTNANGAVPATNTAIAKSDLYGAGSPLRLFVVQLRQGYAVPRPATPAYPVITSTFQEAFQAIRNGAPVEKTLDKAVQRINRDIDDNQGYPQVN